jgi:hypothetical protein
MDNIKEIDSIINSMTDEEHQSLFDKWSREYKKRYYGSHRSHPLPEENSDDPGFEKNLNALLFASLKGKAPHSEWPYASWISGSKNKVDMHFVDCDGCEVWIEIGMYTSQDDDKYNKDFNKLLAVVDKNIPNNVGVLIHFEVFEKGRVFNIFQKLKEQYSDQYIIDTKKFENNQDLIACRLIIQNKKAEQVVGN